MSAFLVGLFFILLGTFVFDFSGFFVHLYWKIRSRKTNRPQPPAPETNASCTYSPHRLPEDDLLYPETGELPASLPGKLAVITCHFNPANWASLRTNYLRFLHEMSWHTQDVFSAEVAFPGQSFPTSDAFIQIRASARNLLWQKERLLNLIVERLPPEYDKIAFIDADVLFLDQAWITQASSLLERFPIVQAFDTIYWLDHSDRVHFAKKGAGYGGRNFVDPTYREQDVRPAEGFGWATRRSVFPLYDRAIDGSGDSFNFHAWTTFFNSHFQNILNPRLSLFVQEYCNSMYPKIQGRIARLPGECIHLYHGSKGNRLYGEKLMWLSSLLFDPAKHVHVDDSGLLAWSDASPKAAKDLLRHVFFARREDDGES